MGFFFSGDQWPLSCSLPMRRMCDPVELGLGPLRGAIVVETTDALRVRACGVRLGPFVETIVVETTDVLLVRACGAHPGALGFFLETIVVYPVELALDLFAGPSSCGPPVRCLVRACAGLTDSLWRPPLRCVRPLRYRVPPAAPCASLAGARASPARSSTPRAAPPPSAAATSP